MSTLLIAIIIIGAIILIFSALGIGGAVWDNVIDKVNDVKKEAEKTADADPDTLGNDGSQTATDTNPDGIHCDLR
ncbi:MAG: hypothetical protein OPY09_03545, partial [Nitrosopumilus sp.]|nr:hypothetical protein [Nitrosopumilus sp.]